MDISIVTDELSGDPETAIELGMEWGVSLFELRGVHDQRVPRVEGHVRRRLVRALKEFGAGVTAISPGLFKIPFPDVEPARSNLGWMDRGFQASWEESRALLADHRDNLLPQSLDFAAEVGARYVIAFSFHRNGAGSGAAPEGVVDVLSEAAEAAAARGLELLVETEEGHWANTGEASRRLAERVGNAAFGINWDPANALIDGDVPYPDGYEAVKAHIRNVHFKDAHVYPDGEWELVADGQVDWKGQIAALARDGYAGAIAIEPHLSPSIAATRAAFCRLCGLLMGTGAASEAIAKKFQPNS